VLRSLTCVVNRTVPLTFINVFEVSLKVTLSYHLLTKIVDRALNEDIGSGDITTLSVIGSDLTGWGYIRAKEKGIIAGLPVAAAVFRRLDQEILFTPQAAEGSWAIEAQILAVVEGRLQSILTGERLALNFLQRLSGIATYTATLKEIIKDFPVNIIDTRKTTPGLRVLEKYAVRVGGGYNHRFGLFDGILIKNNHLKIAGGIRQAVQKARKNVSPMIKIEVEVEDLAGVEEALAAGVDIIMLDNMAPDVMRQAVKIINGRARTEASGRVSEVNILEVAKSGVDFISIGAITHSARALDMALNVGVKK